MAQPTYDKEFPFIKPPNINITLNQKACYHEENTTKRGQAYVGCRIKEKYASRPVWWIYDAKRNHFDLNCVDNIGNCDTILNRENLHWD